MLLARPPRTASDFPLLATRTSEHQRQYLDGADSGLFAHALPDWAAGVRAGVLHSLVAFKDGLALLAILDAEGSLRVWGGGGQELECAPGMIGLWMGRSFESVRDFCENSTLPHSLLVPSSDKGHGASARATRQTMAFGAIRNVLGGEHMRPHHDNSEIPSSVAPSMALGALPLDGAERGRLGVRIVLCGWPRSIDAFLEIVTRASTLLQVVILSPIDPETAGPAYQHTLLAYEERESADDNDDDDEQSNRRVRHKRGDPTSREDLKALVLAPGLHSVRALTTTSSRFVALMPQLMRASIRT